MHLNVLLLLLSMLLSQGSSMEIAGDLVDAGRKYSEEMDLPGEVRIISRFIEEALYSGNSIHAFNLMLRLEGLPLEEGYPDFWFARLAWSCGLAEYSSASLDRQTGSPWLRSRAAGMARQFRGEPLPAAEMFLLSMEQAVSTRQKYYSALDLSLALVGAGMFEEAEEVAMFLTSAFPREGMARAALALSMHGQGRFGQAMSVLQSVYTDTGFSFISRDYARSLMNDLE